MPAVSRHRIGNEGNPSASPLPAAMRPELVRRGSPVVPLASCILTAWGKIRSVTTRERRLALTGGAGWWSLSSDLSSSRPRPGGCLPLSRSVQLFRPDTVTRQARPAAALGQRAPGPAQGRATEPGRDGPVAAVPATPAGPAVRGARAREARGQGATARVVVAQAAVARMAQVQVAVVPAAVVPAARAQVTGRLKPSRRTRKSCRYSAAGGILCSACRQPRSNSARGSR